MSEKAEYLDLYLEEAKERLLELNEALLSLEITPQDIEAVNQLMRAAHTLKSSSLTMGFNKIFDLTHTIEDVMDKVKERKIEIKQTHIDCLFKCVDALESMVKEVSKGEKEKTSISGLLNELNLILKQKKGEVQEKEITASGLELAQKPHLLKKVKSVKVNVKRLDNIMDLVGELLINNLRLQNIKSKHDLVVLEESFIQLEKLTSDLKFEITQARMVPVGQVFERFPRMIRDLAKKEQKEVEFVVEGTEIKLDRSVLDEIGEILIHLLRNSVDHGLELPKDRTKTGKKPSGLLKLVALRKQNQVFIEVIDDGVGFDLEEIKTTALEKGIVNENELLKMSEEQTFNLVFNPRFSTSKKVTEISGRGVGLDAVKNKVEALNGSVFLESKKGKGAKISLQLPLTLAIIQCLLTRVGSERYAIPLSNVSKAIEVAEEDIKSIEGNEVIIFKKEEIPFIRLSELFSLPTEKKQSSTTIIVQRAGELAALGVDELIGEQELIIKPLDESLKQFKGFAGATILGDGRTVLILDIANLF